ncbi:hypothetical protein DFH07DRAFT_354479 [Mycena maculata]|uniref:CBM21 domain-containing protein n=1 Tax=Mycena maculata TaxID=230809 RepID=A0AAD7MGM2_9AGAR|nr:hypothetical protein DFH07DRAFT_354479 [Mycena maculata]
MPYLVPSDVPHLHSHHHSHHRITDDGAHSNAKGHFHLHSDEDEDESSASETDDQSILHARPTPLHANIHAEISIRPRAASAPHILTNGKPLKSSLKGSSSSPHILRTPAHHPRARSATAPPSLAVHFPAPDHGLESVLLFNQRARPVSVSLPLDDETETETETDTGRDMRWAGGMADAMPFSKRETFPFPRAGNSRTRNMSKSPLGLREEGRGGEGRCYELDAPGVPRAPEPGSMVLLERLSLVGASASLAASSNPPELALHGTVLARNAAFEKHVFVHFTLDAWQTTNEVAATWVSDGPASSWTASDANSAGEAPGPGWDRFAFTIRLADHAHCLASRELVLTTRFCAPWATAECVGPYVWCDCGPCGGTSASGRPWVGTGAGSEWWDNNAGRDYRVGFRVVPVPAPASNPMDSRAQIQDRAPNAIPFPTRDLLPSNPPSSTYASPSPSALTVQTAPHSKHAAPPAHPHTPAHAHARALRRLSLRNYAAPVKSTLSISTTTFPQPLQRDDEDEHDRSSIVSSPLGDEDQDGDTPPTSPLDSRKICALEEGEHV